MFASIKKVIETAFRLPFGIEACTFAFRQPFTAVYYTSIPPNMIFGGIDENASEISERKF